MKPIFAEQETPALNDLRTARTREALRGALLTLLSEPVSTAGRPGHVSTVSAPLRGEPRGEVGFRER